MRLSYYFSKFIKKLYIPAIKNSNIDKSAKICSGSHVVDATIEKYTYIGNNCTVLNAEIGKFCSIADNCIIGGPSHPLEWVSTSPVFHEGKNVLRKNFSYHEFKTSYKTKIGNDVWLGNNCLIKNGVEVSTGAVIGMGSVVTKNVGAYEIWAGTPAKLIRKRFTDDQIDALLRSKWWNWDDKLLEKKAETFNDIVKYCNSIGGDIK